MTKPKECFTPKDSLVERLRKPYTAYSKIGELRDLHNEAADEILRLQGMQSETAAITDNDKRWRFLEHGCQWVSWTPIGGETHSFDPRDVKYLQAMRALADKTLHEQVALLRAEADALERRMKK